MNEMTQRRIGRCPLLSPTALLLSIILLIFANRGMEEHRTAAAEPSDSSKVRSTIRGTLDGDRCGSATQRSRRRAARHGLHGAAPRDCAECHRKIVNDWARSAHARAWDNPEFVAETEDRAISECLACHAPSPILQLANSDEPQLRKGQHALGVDCHACHYLNHAYAGPYATYGPHRVKAVGRRLSKSKFCGSCHLGEFDDFESLYVSSLPQPSEAKECVDCHMPAHSSRLTQGHLLSLIHPKRRVRNHRMEVWSDRLLRDAIVIRDLKSRRENVQGEGDADQYEVEFSLTNRGAGHRIPTGQHGHRELRIQVELIATNGHRVAEGEQSLLASYEEGLEPGVATPFSFSLASSVEWPPATVRILVERVNRDRSFRRTLVTAEMPFSR